MKVQSHVQNISVSIVDSIRLDAREAAFLREMAKHCVETYMSGNGACSRLIEALDVAKVPQYDGGPVWGLFEAK